MKIRAGLFAVWLGVGVGCETVTWEVAEAPAGSAFDADGGGGGGRPASLVEVDVSESGQMEVTKNLPKQAAERVRGAVRPARSEEVEVEEE